MKSNRTQARLRRIWISSAMVMAIGTAVGLAGCGGGSGGTAGSDAAASAWQLKGVAVDGYLHGATVFLDIDRDGSPDESEPRTLTDERGAYTLDVTALGAEAAGLPIVVIGGVDTDTGNAFDGRLVTRADLATTGQVVTPLTTLADALVDTGYAVDVADAKAIIATALGLEAADLGRDPVALLASRPAVYSTQVALQRAVDLLVQAKAGEGSVEPHEAHRQAVRALAEVVAKQVGLDTKTPLALSSRTKWRRDVQPINVATLAARVQRPGAGAAAQLAGAVEVAVRRAATQRDPRALRATLQAADDVRKRLKAMRKHEAEDVWTAARQSDGRTVGDPAGPVERLLRDHDDDAVAELKSRQGQTLPPVTAVQPANTKGRLLASNCFQCHGTGGVGGFERIRGGEAAEVVEYLSKPARSDIMAAHAQGYTRAQLADIVAYLRQ